MSRQVSPSTNRPYGVLRVTRVWGTSRATLYRHRRCDEPRPRRRPGPLGPMPDEALVEAIRELLADEPVPRRGLPEDLGTAALRRHPHLQAPRPAPDARARPAGARPGRPAAWPEGPRRHDPHRAGRRDVGHRSDLDPDRRGPGVDLRHGRSRSTECLGIHAARRATRFEALEPLRQGVRACFGAFAEGIAGGLKLRHDHGSQFVADDYQRELAFLGIASSPAFVREPEGNGCVERFIRTLQGEPALGPPLRHHRGAAPGARTPSRTPTTRPGSSSATATRPPRPSERRSSRRSRPRHESATRCLTTVDRYMAQVIGIDPSSESVTIVVHITEAGHFSFRDIRRIF